MSVSVVVIAHNEERHIKKCLISLQRQTKKPDEIVVIAHNCADTTIAIAQKFPQVRVVAYNGPVGVVHARIMGFAEAKGDVVACMDGDSHASPRWLEQLVKPLEDEHVAGVGGMVWFGNSIVANLASISFFFLDKLYRPTYRFYFWGANFVCRKKDYERIGGLTPFVELHEALALHLGAEDLYLSLALSKIGKIVFTPSATVISDPSFMEKGTMMRRSRNQQEDRLKLLKHFGYVK